MSRYYLQCSKPFAKSDFIPYEVFFQDFSDVSGAIATAIEAMPEDDTPVYVIERETGKVVWDSSKEEFESEFEIESCLC